MKPAATENNTENQPVAESINIASKVDSSLRTSPNQVDLLPPGTTETISTPILCPEPASSKNSEHTNSTINRVDFLTSGTTENVSNPDPINLDLNKSGGFQNSKKNSAFSTKAKKIAIPASIAALASIGLGTAIVASKKKTENKEVNRIEKQEYDIKKEKLLEETSTKDDKDLISEGITVSKNAENNWISPEIVSINDNDLKKRAHSLKEKVKSEAREKVRKVHQEESIFDSSTKGIELKDPAFFKEKNIMEEQRKQEQQKQDLQKKEIQRREHEKLEEEKIEHKKHDFHKEKQEEPTEFTSNDAVIATAGLVFILGQLWRKRGSTEKKERQPPTIN